VLGEFDNLILPSAFEWDIDYNENDVVLTVLGPAVGLQGDFNSDGVVDAADYVWLRKLGNTPQNESAWRSHFGRSQSGSSPTAAIPEPTTLVFALLAVGGLAYVCHRERRPILAAQYAVSTTRRSSSCP